MNNRLIDDICALHILLGFDKNRRLTSPFRSLSKHFVVVVIVFLRLLFYVFRLHSSGRSTKKRSQASSAIGRTISSVCVSVVVRIEFVRIINKFCDFDDSMGSNRNGDETQTIHSNRSHILFTQRIRFQFNFSNENKDFFCFVLKFSFPFAVVAAYACVSLTSLRSLLFTRRVLLCDIRISERNELRTQTYWNP